MAIVFEAVVRGVFFVVMLHFLRKGYGWDTGFYYAALIAIVEGVQETAMLCKSYLAETPRRR